VEAKLDEGFLNTISSQSLHCGLRLGNPTDLLVHGSTLKLPRVVASPFQQTANQVVFGHIGSTRTSTFVEVEEEHKEVEAKLDEGFLNTISSQSLHCGLRLGFGCDRDFPQVERAQEGQLGFRDANRSAVTDSKSLMKDS
jgi:hypothetical protein